MARGAIIHLEDNKENLQGYVKVFNLEKIDLEYISCHSQAEFRKAIDENSYRIKSLIFDIVGEKGSNEELEGGNPEFLQFIKEGFAKFNLPIFIYSGRLDTIGETFQENATVFKFSKEDSIKKLYEKLKLFYESGFIDVFCQGGLIEAEIYKDLHKAFTKQFKSNLQIENFITQIAKTSIDGKAVERTQKILKRIVVRTLLSELLAPELDNEGNVIEERVSTVEHYIQRISENLLVWTGDIFSNNEDGTSLFILTPRCNVLRDDTILVCPFILGDIITKKDKISKMLQGDPTVSGYDRHIPPSPIFEGGRLALSKYFMIKKIDLTNKYKRVISLSDELTNEILGKFGVHFFRTGITPWDSNEATEQILNN